jgi:hypothetical protein
MRSKILSTIVVLSLILATTTLNSCKKEDDTQEQLKNSFTYEDETYLIANSLFAYYDNNSSVYAHDLLIYNGFTIHSVNNKLEEVTGTGTGIEIVSIYTNSATELSPGKYVYSNEEFQPYTFNNSGVAINYNNETHTGTNYILTGGEINISKEGNEYVMNYTFTDQNGNSLSGYYKGTVDYYNNYVSGKSQHVNSNFLK